MEQSKKIILPILKARIPKLASKSARIPKLASKSARIPKLASKSARIPKLESKSARIPKLASKSLVTSTSQSTSNSSSHYRKLPSFLDLVDLVVNSGGRDCNFCHRAFMPAYFTSWTSAMTIRTKYVICKFMTRYGCVICTFKYKSGGVTEPNLC